MTRAELARIHSKLCGTLADALVHAGATTPEGAQHPWGVELFAVSAIRELAVEALTDVSLEHPRLLTGLRFDRSGADMIVTGVADTVVNRLRPTIVFEVALAGKDGPLNDWRDKTPASVIVLSLFGDETKRADLENALRHLSGHFKRVALSAGGAR